MIHKLKKNFKVVILNTHYTSIYLNNYTKQFNYRLNFRIYRYMKNSLNKILTMHY